MSIKNPVSTLGERKYGKLHEILGKLTERSQLNWGQEMHKFLRAYRATTPDDEKINGIAFFSREEHVK